MLIDSIGFGLIVPVMPALLKELLDLNAEQAAPWGGYLAFVYAAMNFLCGPTIGNLSDRFGRRPILLLSLGALAIDYLIMGFATSITVLFIGRVLSGICGATYSTANAFIADVTREESERAKAFGLLGAAFGIGFIIGPAVGGMLGTISPRAPFFAAAGLAVLNMAYGMFVLPESLAAENRRPFELKRSNPLGAFAQFSKLPTVYWFIVAITFHTFAHVVYPSTWNFHADARYGWGSREIGWSLMAFGVGSAIVQGGLIGKILKRFGPYRTALAGLLFNVVALIGFALATNEWLVYLWLPIAALGAIVGPSINALMSTRVPQNSQGELQGVMSSVQGLAHMFSPILMTQTFTFFMSERAPVQIAGAAFLLAAALTMFAIFPFLMGVRSHQVA